MRRDPGVEEPGAIGVERRIDRTGEHLDLVARLPIVRFAGFRDGAAGVTTDYAGDPPWRFTGGTIRRVAVDVSGEHYIDLEREAQAMLMRE